MQKDITSAEAVALVASDNGDFGRPSRVLFTVVGAGTIYVDTNPDVTEETGVPFTEGVYGSDEGLRSGETYYAIAGAGETVDVRLMSLGAKVEF